MKKSHERTYRLLCWLSALHASLCFLFLVAGIRLTRDRFSLDWFERNWYAFVTLWFLWPIVLILHRGRSTRRLAGFMVLSTLLLLPSLPYYCLRSPQNLGLPWGVKLEPVSLWKYYSAWWAGRAEAQRDAGAGVMATEVYGFGAGGGDYTRIVRERYHIEIRPVAACMVDETIVGHAAGYNRISQVEIDRRVGPARLNAAKGEAIQLALERTAREEKYSVDLAQRLSGFPLGGKIVLEKVRLFASRESQLAPAMEKQLGLFVREIEALLARVVPESSPPFPLDITATLSASKQPTLESLSHSRPPPETYKKILRELAALRLPQWKGEALSVRLQFAIRAPTSSSTMSPNATASNALDANAD